jgi:hypothetical protein
MKNENAKEKEKKRKIKRQVNRKVKIYAKGGKGIWREVIY